MSMALVWIVTLGMALTLALRPVCRRLCGPEAAFALWALAPLLLVLGFVPAPGPGELPVVLAVIQAPTSLPISVLRAIDGRPFEAAWLAGVAACLLRCGWAAHAWRRTSVALAPMADKRGRPISVRQVTDAGPAVLAGWRPVIVLPAAFETSFLPADAELALAHELAHVRRGDHRSLWLAQVFLAVFWFHPLAWWCRRRFELDMELACDAGLLRQRPADRTRYAEALLRHGAGPSVAWAAGWHQPVQALHRLRWIARSHAPCRHAWIIMIVLLMTVAAVAIASRRPDADVVRISEVPPPVYPAAAIRQRIQGSVVVDVAVSAAGVPGAVQVTRSAGALLDNATINAVHLWHFSPTIRNGLPVASKARVPVDYRLSDEADPAS